MSNAEDVEQIQKDLADSFEQFLRQENGFVSTSSPRIAAEVFTLRFQALQRRESQQEANRQKLELLDRLEKDTSLPPDCDKTCKIAHWHHVTHILIEAERKQLEGGE